MANMLKMMKQASSMKRQMKQIQKELARQSVEFSSGGVTVEARGDMSIARVAIDPETVAPGNVAPLEKQVMQACNGALQAAQKMAGAEMSKVTAGMGLPDLLGGM